MSTNGVRKRQKKASRKSEVVHRPKELIQQLYYVGPGGFTKIINELSVGKLKTLFDGLFDHPSDEYLTVLQRLQSEHAIKYIWRPYLIALNQMDANVPLRPANDVDEKDNSDCYLAAVKKAYLAIYQQQNEELAFMKTQHQNHELISAYKFNNEDFSKITIEQLKARHQQLNALNESLIRSCIDEQSTELDLSYLRITRFPDSLLNDEKLMNYWRKLQVLICDDNELTELPTSIGKLRSLQGLYCTNNRLQNLPNSLGKLRSLQKFICYNNQLREIPTSFGNLLSLELFDCKGNHLKELPASIYNLKRLARLECADNEITILPNLLRIKFGDDWYCEALDKQRTGVTARRAFLPQLATSNAQTQQGKKRDERPSGPTLTEEDTGDLAAHHKRKKR